MGGGRPADVCDVAVVGGGAAGLSAALVLARARRGVVVIDSGQPRNARAAAVHGYLSRDGASPAELAEIGRAEVSRYGGGLVTGRVDSVERDASGFTVCVDGSERVRARRVLVATGLTDVLPDVPGLQERWGRDVIHCPYCHGWEVRDQAIGVLATGPLAVEHAVLFRQWSPDVILFPHVTADPDGEDAEQLAARGVRVVAGLVHSVLVVGDRLAGVRMNDGSVISRQVLVVEPQLAARSEVLAALGLDAPGPDGGDGVRVDSSGRTPVDGVWVAGNVIDPTGQVIDAAASGAKAAMAINADLVAEDVSDAINAHRARSGDGVRRR
jgi:thioredoxin reductase